MKHIVLSTYLLLSYSTLYCADLQQHASLGDVLKRANKNGDSLLHTCARKLCKIQNDQNGLYGAYGYIKDKAAMDEATSLLKTINRLIKKCVYDVNAQNNAGETILHFALNIPWWLPSKTQTSNTPFLETLLMKYDANPNIIAKNGFSPLRYACRKPKNEKTISLLLAHGADIQHLFMIEKTKVHTTIFINTLPDICTKNMELITRHLAQMKPEQREKLVQQTSLMLKKIEQEKNDSKPKIRRAKNKVLDELLKDKAVASKT